MKLWAGRFQKETDTLVNDFNSSIAFDARMYKEDIAGSIAHAAMLGRQGIIEEHEAEKIIDGLKAILEDIKAERLDDLMMLQQSIAMEKSEARLGTQPLVLCEGKKGKSYYGRSQMEAPESDGKIWFTSERPIAPGEFVRVKITRAEPYDLYGEAIQ